MSDSEEETSKDASITLPEQAPQRLKVKRSDHTRPELSGQELQVCPKAETDFAVLIGIAPLDEEWDRASAVEVVNAMRGETEERAALQSAVPHPNVSFLVRR